MVDWFLIGVRYQKSRFFSRNARITRERKMFWLTSQSLARLLKHSLAQSAGTVEYTDCNTSEG